MAWTSTVAAICCAALSVALAGMLFEPGPAAQQAAFVRPTKPVWRAIDRITLDVDARPLRGSNLRLAVFPASAPDDIGDLNDFTTWSTPIAKSRLRMSIPPGRAGRGEVRLVYIPADKTHFVVAARAPVEILPPWPGATVLRDVMREANAVSEEEYNHRHGTRELMVEAQFVRPNPQGFWVEIVGKIPTEKAVDFAGVTLGEPGLDVPKTIVSEISCVMRKTDPAIAARIRALKPGDGVVVSGTPLVIFKTILMFPCTFAN